MNNKIFAHLQRAQELLQNRYAFGAIDTIDTIDLTSENGNTDDEATSSKKRKREEEEEERPRRKGTKYASHVVDTTNDLLRMAQNMNPHQLYLPQLTVTKSTIIRAHNGLFTTEDLEGGVIVAVYTGILATKRANKRKTHRVSGTNEKIEPSLLCVGGDDRDMGSFMNELPLPGNVEEGVVAPTIPNCYFSHALVSLEPVVDATVEIPVIVSRYAKEGEAYIATAGQELFAKYGEAFERDYPVSPVTVPLDLRVKSDEEVQDMFEVFCKKVNTKAIAVGLTYGTVSKKNCHEPVPQKVQQDINRRNKNAQNKAESLVPKKKK